jgi:hypothetical protein
MYEQRIRDQELSIQNLSRAVEEAGRAGASGERHALERLQDLGRQMAQAEARLEALMTEWERLAA